MATCGGCHRTLPPNGRCTYCGDLGAHDGPSRRSSSNLGHWIKGLLKLAAAVGLCAAAYWILFTENGHTFAEGIQESIGLKKKRKETPALKILMGYPKVVEFLKDMSVDVQEEELASELRQVTLIKQEPEKIFSAAFRVDLTRRTATPMDGNASSLMR